MLSTREAVKQMQDVKLWWNRDDEFRIYSHPLFIFSWATYKNAAFRPPVFYELTFHCLSSWIRSGFSGFCLGAAHRRTLPTAGTLWSSHTCCRRVKCAEICNFHRARLSPRGSPWREGPNWNVCVHFQALIEMEIRRQRNYSGRGPPPPPCLEHQGPFRAWKR